MGKTKILQTYLAKAPVGNGVKGLPAASKYYFSKSPQTLSKGEAVFLPTLLQNPARFNPLIYPERTYKRYQFLLRRLHKGGLLKAEDYQYWKTHPPPLHPTFKQAITAPHFIFWARNTSSPFWHPLPEK